MFITIPEIIDLVIMTAVVGFIFSDVFPEPASRVYDPIKDFMRRKRRFDLRNFKFAVMVTAPAIILHEMGHKVAALSFGVQSTFHAAYLWLGVGILLKLISPGFIFFVPAYVSFAPGVATHGQLATIAFAGPGVNLVLFLGSWFFLKRVKNHKLQVALHLTKKINLFLFIFNMIPFGFFDGAKVFSNLLAMF